MAKKKPDKLDRVIDALTQDQSTAEILKDGSILKELQKRFIECALTAQMIDYWGYTKGSPDGNNTGNGPNGKTRKIFTGPEGDFEIETPRDRGGSFEPQLVHKRQVRI